MQVERAPKVSVCVVTYNQEKYIRQCLQSLVDQVTDFAFEVIVSDDASTDKTPLIIQEFADKYPYIIKPILHEKNIGAYANFKFIHTQPVGEYIAHVDGDDYALPGKLQAQADFLDLNINCNIVFHRMIILEKECRLNTDGFNKRLAHHKFYRKNIIELVSVGANSSKMYRATNRVEMLPDFDVVDYTVNVLQVGDGYAAYCSEKPLGVYRKGIGISGSPAVINSVYRSLLYFKAAYPECRPEINAASLGWLASNIKNKRQFKKEFLWLALSTLSITGIMMFAKNRIVRKGF